MKLFNRSMKTVALSVPAYLWYFLKCFVLFKRPVAFIRSYLTYRPMPGQLVELRNGLKIHLSGAAHDVVTVFVIFVRKDYGAFPAGRSVVDIGANIGVFALYAVRVLKAREVHAYEPHPGSFACLRRNIAENGLEGRIHAHELAVSDAAGRFVEMTVSEGPSNRILATGHTDTAAANGIARVATTDLSAILQATGGIGLLKLDCEGSEYDILFGAPSEALRRVGEIRMEYHHGRVDELDRLLGGNGFSRTRSEPQTDTLGLLWYARVA